MEIKRIVSIILLAVVVAVAFADNNYKVSSSSRLNVRKYPSTSAGVLGTFSSGQQIEVLSISKGWAKVKYNGVVGYVSDKYIVQFPSVDNTASQNTRENQESNIVDDDSFQDSPYDGTYSEAVDYEEYGIDTPVEFGSSLSDSLNLYLAVQAGCGWSSFIWGKGDVNGTVSGSVDIVGQLYFEDKVSFIPANWYSELALGYDKRGAAKYDMNYIHLQIYPFGYRIPLNPINIVVKAGPTLGFALNDFDEWNSDFQFGFGGGFQVDWKQFSIGCNVGYDFTEVSSSCNQTLNNIAVLGTISYKFAKFGHK